jgi:hypothetical protein
MSRWAFRGLTVFLGVGCTVGLVHVAATIFLRVPLDPNEGWNAYHSLAAMSGGALYPPADSFVFNNYPPLSFYIVGALGNLIGDHIVAGRFVSLLAALGVASGAFTALRMMRVDALRALFVALLFVAGLLIFTDYVGMDDPQLLAHAVAMGGLLLLLKEPRTTASIVTVALLLAIAGFIKHNLIALPAALVIWLAVYDRRSAVRFAGAGIGVSVIGVVLFRLTYGVSVLAQLNSPRLWSGMIFTENLTQFLIWCDVALFGAAVLLLLWRGDRNVALCVVYAAMSVIVGTAFAGGSGVDLNIWFDAAIALSLCCGLVLQRLAGRLGVGVALAYSLPLLAGLWLNWDDAWLTRDYWLHPFAEETVSTQADIAFMQSHNGPALCEMLSLCYWAGKREEADVFNLGQAYATHSRSDESLIRLIAVRHYATIEFDSLDNFALSPDVRKALLNAYRIEHIDDNGVFLLPR